MIGLAEINGFGMEIVSIAGDRHADIHLHVKTNLIKHCNFGVLREILILLNIVLERQLVFFSAGKLLGKNSNILYHLWICLFLCLNYLDDGMCQLLIQLIIFLRLIGDYYLPKSNYEQMPLKCHTSLKNSQSNRAILTCILSRFTF